MGKVFTWDEVRKGGAPVASDFARLVSSLSENLSREACITDALMFGSVIRGDPTIRSDVDCMVVFDVARGREAFSIMHRLTRQADQYRIPLSWVPCDTSVAGTRLHHFGPSFLQHLKRCALHGGLIKGRPVEAFVQGVSKKEETESYLRFKLNDGVGIELF